MASELTFEAQTRRIKLSKTNPSLKINQLVKKESNTYCKDAISVQASK